MYRGKKDLWDEGWFGTTAPTMHACSETCDNMHGNDQLAQYPQLMKPHQPHQQLTLGSGWMSMSYISQCAEFLSQA
jgi:hypothetical protein